MGITFLFPAFLWALPLALLPILIHLLNFQRPKKVAFTRVVFLEKLNESQKNIKRIKDWLVLAARVLFLALLIMAFAQPTLPDAQQQTQQGSRRVLLYIDNSYSMEKKAGDGTLLNNALSIAQELVQTANPNTRFQIMSNDFEGKDFYFLSRSEALDRLSEITHSSSLRSWPAIAQRQIAAKNRHGEANFEGFWLTDAQKSSAGDLSQLPIDSTLPSKLIRIDASASSNLFIDSIYLANDFSLEGKAKEIRFRLQARGNEEELQVPVKLFLDGVQTATALYKLQPNQTMVESFSIPMEQKKEVRGKLEISGPGPAFDDTALFVLRPMPKLKVTAIHHDPSSFVEKAFANQQLFDFHSYSSLKVDYEQARKSDLLVIYGIQRPLEGLSQLVEAMMKKGKSVLVIPSEQPDIQAYNNLLGAEFGQVEAATATTLQKIAQPQAKSPFYQGVFERQPENVELPQAKNCLKLPPGGQTILQYRNGQAFLKNFSSRKGRQVYLLGAHLGDSAGNFPRHSYWLVTLYRMARFSFPQETDIAHRLDENSLKLAQQVLENKAPVRLKQGALEVLPEVRLAQGKWLLTWENDLLKPGFYELQEGSAHLQSLAFNMSPEESFPATYSEEELQQALPSHFQFYQVDAANDAEQKWASLKEENKLWNYFVIAALVFLLAEMALLRYFKPQRTKQNA